MELLIMHDPGGYCIRRQNKKTAALDFRSPFLLAEETNPTPCLFQGVTGMI
jgi:hypothetical protein